MMERRAKMLEMWHAGKTGAEIADTFGITRQCVAYHLRGHGLGGARKRSQDRKREMEQLHRAGKTVVEIAAALTLSIAYVSKYLMGVGLSTKGRMNARYETEGSK